MQVFKRSLTYRFTKPNQSPYYLHYKWCTWQRQVNGSRGKACPLLEICSQCWKWIVITKKIRILKSVFLQLFCCQLYKLTAIPQWRYLLEVCTKLKKIKKKKVKSIRNMLHSPMWLSTTAARSSGLKNKPEWDFLLSHAHWHFECPQFLRASCQQSWISWFPLSQPVSVGLRGHLTNDHQVHSVREGLQQGHGMAVVNVDEAVTIGLKKEGEMREKKWEKQRWNKERWLAWLPALVYKEDLTTMYSTRYISMSVQRYKENTQKVCHVHSYWV